MRSGETNEAIVRTEDGYRYGLHVKDIYGLNIFQANDVNVAYSEDPRLLFLKRVTEILSSSAHLGWLALKDLVDNPEEAFGASTTDNYYIRTSLSIHGGTFYELDSAKAVLFPHIEGRFWQVSGISPQPIEYCVQSDALALYAGAEPEATEALIKLANNPFPGQEQWLRELSSLYSLIIISQDDGWYFEIYSRSAVQFQALDTPLLEAVASIKTSSWYQQHQAELEWDDGPDNCLKLPI